MIDDGGAAREAWSDLVNHTPGWIEEHITAAHSIPSASTVEDCILKTWYAAKERPPDIKAPTAWKKRAITGIISEFSWLAVFKMAEFKIDRPESLPFAGGLMRGRPDAVLQYQDSPKFVLELKERNGWAYKRYIENKYASVSAINPETYSQIQVYLDATGLDWALLLTSPADYSMLQSMMRKQKKYGETYELPDFHLEWILKNPDHIQYIIERTKKIKEAIKSDSPPMREFDGIPVGLDGKKTWPCGYCVYNPSCTTEFGYGDR